MFILRFIIVIGFAAFCLAVMAAIIIGAMVHHHNKDLIERNRKWMKESGHFNIK